MGLEDTRDVTALEGSKVRGHKRVQINIGNVSLCIAIQACVSSSSIYQTLLSSQTRADNECVFSKSLVVLAVSG